jgi:hypothetical protein
VTQSGPRRLGPSRRQPYGPPESTRVRGMATLGGALTARMPPRPDRAATRSAWTAGPRACRARPGTQATKPGAARRARWRATPRQPQRPRATRRAGESTYTHRTHGPCRHHEAVMTSGIAGHRLDGCQPCRPRPARDDRAAEDPTAVRTMNGISERSGAHRFFVLSDF